MYTKIDWMSFTVKREVGEGDTEQTVLQQVWDSVDQLYEGFWYYSGMTESGEWRAGRKPYRASYCRADGGVCVFVHPNLDHALIEVSGKGCDTLADFEGSVDLLEAIAPRLTRLDVACDMLVDTRPLEFVAQRDEGRFKAHSEIVSESGETCYIGSRTSNRYARVYRYNPPHERSHLLRCEFVVKAEDAKNTALAVVEHGHLSVAATLGEQFGWRHADWQPTAPTLEDLKAYRPDRREGKTLFWLADTVAPLLVRLHKEGVINVHDWFGENILPKVDFGDRL